MENKINLNEKEVINLFLKEDLSPLTLAKRFNCYHGQIYKILRKNNIELKEKGYYRKKKLDEKKIIKLYLYDRLNTPEIAKIFNTSSPKIMRVLRENEIEIRKGSGLDEGEIIGLYVNKEKNAREISRIFGCSRSPVLKILKANKIKIRTQEERWKNEEYADRVVKATLEGLKLRPTSYEKKISELCIDNDLPFIYTGNGTFLIGRKNPDFVNKENRIAIEVFYSYFKVKRYGSVENYTKQRREYFAKHGYKTIFITEKEVLSKDWEEVCLNKINNFMENANSQR